MKPFRGFNVYDAALAEKLFRDKIAQVQEMQRTLPSRSYAVLPEHLSQLHNSLEDLVKCGLHLLHHPEYRAALRDLLQAYSAVHYIATSTEANASIPISPHSQKVRS